MSNVNIKRKDMEEENKDIPTKKEPQAQPQQPPNPEKKEKQNNSQTGNLGQTFPNINWEPQLDKITDDVAKKLGYNNAEELKEKLNEFYKELCEKKGINVGLIMQDRILALLAVANDKEDKYGKKRRYSSSRGRNSVMRTWNEIFPNLKLKAYGETGYEIDRDNMKQGMLTATDWESILTDYLNNNELKIKEGYTLEKIAEELEAKKIKKDDKTEIENALNSVKEYYFESVPKLLTADGWKLILSNYLYKNKLKIKEGYTLDEIAQELEAKKIEENNDEEREKALNSVKEYYFESVPEEKAEAVPFSEISGIESLRKQLKEIQKQNSEYKFKKWWWGKNRELEELAELSKDYPIKYTTDDGKTYRITVKNGEIMATETYSADELKQIMENYLKTNNIEINDKDKINVLQELKDQIIIKGNIEEVKRLLNEILRGSTIV